MKDRNEQQKPKSVDGNLDIPSEAGREKHINLLDEEDINNKRGRQERDCFVEERRREWHKGHS